MPDNLLEKLRDAHGESCQILAAFVDVRGFSSFARVAESVDTALYLRTMYTRVIDEYLQVPTFVKPTGDGLMLIRELGSDENDLVEQVRAWISGALELIGDFGRITERNLLINIEVPEHVGIGVARGSATRLTAEDGSVLDYSGRCLNLAARLMDLARPEGVVLHDKHAFDLLGEDIRSEMETAQVYIRGIAEDRPIEAWISKDWVQLSPSALTPLAHEPSFDVATRLRAAEVRANSGWLLKVNRKPRPGQAIVVASEWEPHTSEGLPRDVLNTDRLQGQYILEPSGHFVEVEFGNLASRLDEDNVPDEEEISFTPLY